MHIHNNERFLLLKLMNSLYGISLAEDAVNTQCFLSKIIQFFKYYTLEETKLVRLKEELDSLRLFSQLITVGSGNQYSVLIDISDAELLNLYIPSKSLLQLVMEVFRNSKETADESGCVLMKVNQKDEAVVITIEGMCPADTHKMPALADGLVKSLQALTDLSASTVADSAGTRAIEIHIKANRDLC